MEKKCSTCQIFKQLIEFNKCKTNKDGLHYCCKSCRKIEREKNSEKRKEKQKEYYEKNKELLIIKNKNYRNENKEKIKEQKKEYRLKNIEHIRQKNKEYLPIRKEKIKEKRKTDKNFQIKEVLRSKIHKLLKNQKTSFLKILGCNFEQFKKWIEFQFEEDMNWDNFGKIWQIDHILPIYQFNLLNENEKNICFSWTNLQPLYNDENRKKYRNLELHYYFNSIITINRFIKKEKLEVVCYQKINESLSWLRKKLRYGENAMNDKLNMSFEMGNQQPSS